MATVKMIAPGAAPQTIYAGPGFGNIVAGSDGTASVDASIAPQMLKAGWQYATSGADVAYFECPPTADLVSIVAAATPTSGTPMTIAAQPAYPCKLQVRGVYSGAVTGLSVTIVGVDGRNNSVTETVNVAASTSTTFPTVNAYAHVTSVTPNGTVTNVTTLGVGQGTALALPLPPTFVDFTVYKEMVATAGTAATPADETVGTVDTVAGTIAPTTAANGTKCFYFYYTWVQST